MKILGIIASSILKKITDTFSRTTSGSLGTATTGQPWVATRGTWYANGSAAQSDDAASNNSIASLNLGSQNASVSVEVSSGTGAVVWLTDADSWWASTYVQQNYSNPYSYSCPDCYYNACKTCSSYTCAGLCGNATADTMICSCGLTASRQVQVFGCNANLYTYNYCLDTIVSCGSGTSKCMRTEYYDPYNCACGNASPDTNNCGCCCSAGYDCYPGNCIGYNNGTNHYLKLIKSVGGTVSEATGAVSLGATAAVIALSTSGDTLTAKAYSDTGKTTQIGTTITYTATSPTKGTSIGIIKVTSDNQGSTVDNFTGDTGA